MSDEENTASAFGLEIQALPEGCIPLEAVVLVKCLDEDGDPTIELRSTDALSSWDRIGIWTVALDVTRESAASCWRPVGEDDE